MNVNDFDFIRVIGRGSYAKVIYVSNLSILMYLKCGLCNRERYFTVNIFLSPKLCLFSQVTHKKTERKYAMKIVKKELVNDDEVSAVDFFIFFVQCFSHHA